MCTGVTDPGYKALPVATSNYQHPTEWIGCWCPVRLSSRNS